MRDGKRFGWLSGYLAGLSIAQRAAAGMLLVVMIATAAWIGGRSRAGSWSAHGNALEPILDQPFADVEVRSITDRLNARSVPHEVRDGKVYVPADRKLDALSDLYYASVLTGNNGVEGGFDALIKQMSAFDPPSKTDKMFNRAREQTCENVIGHFHGVRKATVVIDPTNERHIGQSILPSAMVDIQTQENGSNARQLSAAAANVLTGCVAQLARDRVKVTVDGATYNTGSLDDLVGTDELIARKQQCEQVYSAKVRQLLSYIPDVMVSVSVDLNVQSSEEERRTVDAKTASAASTGTSLETVIANAVPTLGESADQATGSNASAKAPASETVHKTRTPAGKETIRSASVVVPRSYFVGIYKRANRKQSQAADPDDALLQPVVDAHLAKIRGLVKNSLGLESDEDVTVEPYDDFASKASLASANPAPVTTNVAGVAAVASTPSSASQLMNANPQQIALAVLTLITVISLSLLMRRRAGEGEPQLATAAAMPPARGEVLSGTLETPASTSTSSPLPAVAGATHAEEAESHRMFHRVRDVVGENPDDAARVLREWIYQGQ